MTDWPFLSETLTAQNVMMGKFRLPATSVSSLGRKDEVYQWGDDGEEAINMTADSMSSKGFSQLVLRGAYFVSSTEDNDNTIEHIGQYRIKFHYN